MAVKLTVPFHFSFTTSEKIVAQVEEFVVEENSIGARQAQLEYLDTMRNIVIEKAHQTLPIIVPSLLKVLLP